MGTTERSKSGTRRTAFEVQPAFVLVGAPGIGKTKIADTLARDYYTEKLLVFDELMSPKLGALGLMADYRTELAIASRRATQLHSSEMPALYTHSLVDSLGYALTRIENQITYGVGSEHTRESWALTMATIGLMLTDTYKADETIFLRFANVEEDSDGAKLQEMFENILEGYEFNYTIVDVVTIEQAVEDVANIIESYVE